MASILFDQALFPDHPYGNPDDGFIETVQRISREDMVEFHQRYFGPSRMILIVAGAVQDAQVTELAKKYFEDWNNSELEEFSIPAIPPAPEKIIRRHKSLEEKSQTDLEIGTLGPSRLSEDYLPIYLGNNILGQFGLMGRIGESVRSKSGLAYHA